MEDLGRCTIATIRSWRACERRKQSLQEGLLRLRLWATPNPTHGATFHFALPARDPVTSGSRSSFVVDDDSAVRGSSLPLKRS